jgi:tellurite resistance protein
MQQNDEWKDVTSLPAATAPTIAPPRQTDQWRDAQGFSGQAGQQPQREYSWGEVPRQALRSFPSSLGGVYKDTLSALASPIETGKAMAQMLGGAAISALPEGGQQWLMSVANDPQKMQESINMARAAGGQIAQDYGTSAGFRRKLAEDPAAVLADFSILFSGGAAATARAAPAASSALRVAENLTNPFVPLSAMGDTRFGREAFGTARDIVTGAGGERVARNIITEALGEQNIPTIAQLSDPQFRNMSAAEAVLASGVDRPQFQALGAQVAQRDPQNLYFRQEQAAQAQRQGLLAAVTPDEQAARAFRAEASDPYYQAARGQVMSVTPDLRSSLDALPNNVLNEARKLAKLDPDGPGQLNLAGDAVDGRTLGYISSAIRDELAKPQATTTTGRTQRRMLGDRLDVITREIEAQIPDFREGRQVFAELSPPVDQAQVLGEMQRRLTGPMDQERPGQFMRVLGEGEQAMLRRSTGSPRYQEGDLMRILSEEQGRAVTEVSDQLMRRERMGELAQRGQAGLTDILFENRPLARRIPGMLQREVLLANRAISMLEGRVAKKTQAALENAMLSGENLNTFMNSVPAAERRVINSVLDQVFDIQNMRNIGLIERLQEEEEPFRAELRGMAQ